MSKARDIASATPAPSTVSSTELGYLDGVTSAIQTQIDGKQAANANVSTTELGYLDGVTSAIQTQLDGKIAKTLTTTTGDMIYASSANTPARLGIGSSGQVLTVSGGVPAWAAAASGNTNPAFRAYRNGTQSITSGADTKVAFNAESYDTNSCFDSTTNYRFTPNVAGYYQFNAGISYGGSSITRLQLHIYKNGASYARIYDASDATVYSTSGSDLIYANGTTDYFEIYGEITGSSPSFGGGDSTYTWFSGSWVRS